MMKASDRSMPGWREYLLFASSGWKRSSLAVRWWRVTQPVTPSRHLPRL